MLVLRVVGSENASNAPLPSAQFDARGGTIGREASNRLVLPDPERFISRVQAEVVQRLGEYVLVNRGMGPITINGRPLQHGDESVLRVRDQLRIGGYRIEVDWVTGTADSVPIDERLRFRPAAILPSAMNDPQYLHRR